MNRTFALVRSILACTTLAAAALAADAHDGHMSAPGVQVNDAWAKPSLAGQKTTGAYMRISVTEPMTLLAARSPAADAVELHEMKLDGDVMRMREISSLPLQPGKPVEFKPGGSHLMLTGLVAPLAAGATVPLTLVLRDGKGAQRRVELRVPVAAQAPGVAGGARVQDRMQDHHGGDAHAHGH